MAETDRTSDAAILLEQLIERGSRISFFQALLLLERLFPRAAPIGREGPASDEAVRLRPSLSLAHPASDVEAIERADQRIRLTATFFGLYGVDSPLPPSYPEHLVRISDERDGERVRGFLDIFHHRLLSLLYRVWKKARPSSARSDGAPLYDRLLSLVGYSDRLGLGGGRLPRLPEARLCVLRSRTVVGLTALLEHRLGYRCTVSQLERRLVEIPVEQRSRIGSHNCRIGETLVAGARVIDCNRLMIKVTAKDFEMWERLMPEGEERAEIDGGIAAYLRDPVDFGVEVTMAGQHAPPVVLGKPRYRLGRTAWLGQPKKDISRRFGGRPPSPKREEGRAA